MKAILSYWIKYHPKSKNKIIILNESPIIINNKICSTEVIYQYPPKSEFAFTQYENILKDDNLIQMK